MEVVEENDEEIEVEVVVKRECGGDDKVREEVMEKLVAVKEVEEKMKAKLKK